EGGGVGGPLRRAATPASGRAGARARPPPLGGGTALHRYQNNEGSAGGTQFPAIRRRVFDEVGLFDERLVRNQDDEFNFRIQRAGGKVFVSSRVRYQYFVRERVGQLFRQYFQYGFWRIPVMAKHRRPTTLRPIVPTVFYTASVLLALLGAWWRNPILAAAFPGLYLAILLIVAAITIPRHGLRVASCVALAIATMHAGYAWGLAYGMWA